MDELVHREEPSPNWDARDERISMVVLHYTDMPSVDAALARLCDPAAKVSAHYLITEEGEVVQLGAVARAFGNRERFHRRDGFASIDPGCVRFHVRFHVRGVILTSNCHIR